VTASSREIAMKARKSEVTWLSLARTKRKAAPGSAAFSGIGG
jgi:hypothetical protein